MKPFEMLSTIHKWMVILLLVHLNQIQTHTLSVSPNITSSGGGGSGIKSSVSQQPNMMQLATTMPPLMTTISHNNYLDSLVESGQSQLAAKQQTLQDEDLSNQMSERRATSDEHEDSVPQPTINNHSRNNQNINRPQQYVDVSALVGRNMSAVVGLPPQSSSLMPGNQLPAGLSGKSRSGLPECATQQVCNAIFMRMNYTQKLCECSSNYNWHCSSNPNNQDGHTIDLTRKYDKRIYTQIKTCEPMREVKQCKSPTDWTLLALQSERTGKAHYVVVCKCPTYASLEGPYTHNHPPYANIQGIRVYGMLCAHQTARSSAQNYNPALNAFPKFPWSEALNVINATNLISNLDSH